MEESSSGESSLNGLDEMTSMKEREVNDEIRAGFSMSPEPEKLFVEAVRKLSSYEHSLESLVKRFDRGGIQTDSEIHLPETTERLQNSYTVADDTLGKTDLSAGGDCAASKGGRETSSDCQKFVKIQIPFRTAETILRILNEDLDKNHRSALKQAESFLNQARRNLVNVKKLLQRQVENSDGAQESILTQTNKITNDMFAIIDKLSEKLVECQVQNLSELLVRSMEDETRLSMLAKRPQVRNDVETVNVKARFSVMPSKSKSFYFFIFGCVASYFVARLMMLYLEREKESLEKAYLFIWLPFQEEMKQFFANLKRGFNWFN